MCTLRNNTIELLVSNNHVLTFRLTLTSHLTFKKCTPLNFLVTSFRLPPSVYFYGPSFMSYQGVIFTPSSAARSAGDPIASGLKRPHGLRGPSLVIVTIVSFCNSCWSFKALF